MKACKSDIQFGRFDIAYRVYGSGERTIFCLSGAKQTMPAWRSFIRFFKSDYRIVVFDMPGQGRSKIRSGNPRINLDEQVQVVHRLVKELGIDDQNEACIVGGSWGSVVAAAYASRYPEVFTKVALGSFGTKPNVVLQAIIEKIQQMIECGAGKEIAALMIEEFGQNIPETLQRQMIAQFQTMTDHQFQTFYEHACFVTEMGDLSEHIDLARIPAPTLVLMGQNDTIMDLFDAKRAASMIPNSQYSVVKSVGHFLHWEDERLLDVYASFFASGELENEMVSLQAI